jgi:hypothetical protein
MSKSILALGTLALLFGVSCYSPDLSAVRYSCDEANPYCPDGLDCIGGMCVKPGSGNTNADGPPASVSDGGATVAGCRYGGGTDLGGGVFACPGVFSPTRANGAPKASELCANGATICTMPRSANQTTCNALTGFFGAAVPARYNGGGRGNPSNYSCQSTNNGQDRAVAGCGRLTNNQVMDKNCSGFTRVLDCTNVTSWQCYSGTLDDNHENTNPSDGVLCCLP